MEFYIYVNGTDGLPRYTIRYKCITYKLITNKYGKLVIETDMWSNYCLNLYLHVKCIATRTSITLIVESA